MQHIMNALWWLGGDTAVICYSQLLFMSLGFGFRQKLLVCRPGKHTLMVLFCKWELVGMDLAGTRVSSCVILFWLAVRLC